MIHRFGLATFVITCPSSWERQATRELKALLPDATCRVLFMPGNLLVNTELPRAEALQILEAAETQLVGHVVPVDLRVDITKERTSLEQLLEGALELDPLDPQFSFRVTCNRRGNHEFGSRDVEHHVGNWLVDIWRVPADLDVPEQIVGIEIFQDLAFLGACFADERLQKDISQMRKHAPGQRPLNRAEKKLREAFTKFGIRLPARARALDLGSAPGGWAKVLAEVCGEVVAVDPAQLDERVLALANVTHVAMRAEHYLPTAEGWFDLVTCDMNVESPFAAELLVQAAPHLRDDGAAILTIKFGSRFRREHVRRAVEVLEAAYTDFATKHLPHNGKETTLHMRKKPS